MRLLAYLRSLPGRFFHRSQVEDDMDEELRSHIQHRADDLERSGLVAAWIPAQRALSLDPLTLLREE